MQVFFEDARWINRPEQFAITDGVLSITTEPHTDFWQRTYYGFRNDNAPALLVDIPDNFTLTVRVAFKYREKYDQCGLILYLDSANWFKASVEFEDASISRLGSVVPNRGYSDWATQDILTPSAVRDRLSRRGPDFRMEYDVDGKGFRQMRIFHLHAAGETVEEHTGLDSPPSSGVSLPVGFYACSPLDSSFTALFDGIEIFKNIWGAS